MTSEILTALARSNLAAAAAILAVAVMRPWLRRFAGAGVAYAAWLVVPLAAVASLAPARSVVTIIARRSTAPAPLPHGLPSPMAAAPSMSEALLRITWQDALLGVWLFGAAIGVAWLLWRQHRFLVGIGPVRRDGAVLRAQHSMAGPAVVGVFAPKILTPADFDQRFSPREQEVVLAHERTHIAKGDPGINALVLLWQCLNWFNPLAHLGARLLRLDQEFACDAAVLRRFPNARRSYAEAMLKAQTAAMALPLGCYWPATATLALEQRLLMLKAQTPSPRRRTLGTAAAALLALMTSLAVWGAQPVRRIVLQAPAAIASALPTASLPEMEQAMLAAIPVKAPIADEAAERPQTTMEAAPAPTPFSVSATIDASPDAVAQRAASVVANWVNTWRPPQPPNVPGNANPGTPGMTPWTPPAPAGVAAQRSPPADDVPAAVVNSSASWSPPDLRPGASVEISVSTQLPTGRMIGEQVSHRAGTNSSAGTWITDPHYILKPNARQLDDDRVEFRPAFYLDGHLLGSGRVVVSGSGGTTTMALDNGQQVTLTAILHPSADGPPRPG
jgi:beta-lactamase regulating signal transducer with metallopeptidase domain